MSTEKVEAPKTGGHKRTLVGKVPSAKMEKTVVVEVGGAGRPPGADGVFCRGWANPSSP